ncbi:hypothetical protein LMG28688_01754 [Paraburkholderia caffeinitolerans]|uniref:Uncharacterized protein n=1 Tax=Paraburkholderia caffeinitolerans TaxID=1723730 RepID=A0A6J5FNN4_9BURK|nr:hypothetical protein [Paraburkholderia caffeinitolerans]CAB3783989.1 hypothetical protein LMG28688_01754 [Paraburkholderia caffeinitolerans]
MKAATTMPYRCANSARLGGGSWEIVSANAPGATASSPIEIDYLSTIQVRRQLSVDAEGVRRDCGLPEHVPLLVSASWSSAGTFVKRCLAQIELSDRDIHQRIDLSGEIPGAEVAGTLQIETSILLARDNAQAAALIAKYAGSVLARDRHAVCLDESTSRFPVEIVDFNAVFWANPEAGWRLSWNSLDMEAPFLRSVRLFVNAGHARVVQAVSDEPPSPEAKAIRDAIYFDVARSLILGALRNDEFVSREGSYGDGTCGRAIYTLIQLLFPGDGLDGLKSAAEQRPEQFGSDLQGKLRVFYS